MVELQTISKHHRKEVHNCNRWIVIITTVQPLDSDRSVAELLFECVTIGESEIPQKLVSVFFKKHIFKRIFTAFHKLFR